MFSWDICEIYFTEHLWTSGGVNKKRSKVHKQGVLLKIIVTTQLTDYLTKHSILLFKIKQWTPRVPLMLKTLFVSLEPKNVDFLANFCQKLSSFKMIQIDCVHRILFCSSHSVLWLWLHVKILWYLDLVSYNLNLMIIISSCRSNAESNA